MGEVSTRFDKRLDKVILVSEKVVEAEKAVAKLKKGGNSPAKAVLIRLAEAALVQAVRWATTQLRARAKRKRDSSGKFT